MSGITHREIDVIDPLVIYYLLEGQRVKTRSSKTTELQPPS